MKKFISLLLVAVMFVCFAACGKQSQGDVSEESKPMVEIKGAFRNISNNRVTVVFDYSDYETPLPENTNEITLKLNDSTYEVLYNSSSTSHDTGVTTKFFDCYKRYYGYSYALGYGELEQDTTERMMAVFNNVDETDFSNVLFTLGKYTVNLESDDFTEITSQSEIIKVEENYEEAYQIAAFKWRIDSAYSRAEAMDIYDKVKFGSDFNYLSEQIALIFDSDVSWGVEIFADPGINLTYKGIAKEDVVNDVLPSFDVDVVKKAYPDAVTQIENIIKNTNKLSKDILDPGKSLDDFDFKGTRGAIKGTYAELCKIFDMDLIIATHS